MVLGAGRPSSGSKALAKGEEKSDGRSSGEESGEESGEDGGDAAAAKAGEGVKIRCGGADGVWVFRWRRRRCGGRGATVAGLSTTSQSSSVGEDGLGSWGGNPSS